MHKLLILFIVSFFISANCWAVPSVSFDEVKKSSITIKKEDSKKQKTFKKAR